MDELPRLGEAIILTDLGRYSYTSRVEGADGAQGASRLTVARPMGLPASSPYGIGAHFDLSWVADSGIYVLPVRLVGSRREGVVALWDFEAVGNTWVEQRRAFARVPLFGRVVVRPVVDGGDGDSGDGAPDDGAPDDGAPDGVADEAGVGVADGAADGWTEGPSGANDPDDLAPAAGMEAHGTGDDARDLLVRGVMVDLSEAALQCTLWAHRGDERIQAGRQVMCEFWIHSEKLRRRGLITTVRAARTRTAGQCNVVIEFDQSSSDADALRHHVYAIQIHMRRSSKIRAVAAREAAGAVDTVPRDHDAHPPAAILPLRPPPAPPPDTSERSVPHEPGPVPGPSPADRDLADPDRADSDRADSDPADSDPADSDHGGPTRISPVERLFQVGKPGPEDVPPEFRADL